MILKHANYLKKTNVFRPRSAYTECNKLCYKPIFLAKHNEQYNNFAYLHVIDIYVHVLEQNLIFSLFLSTNNILEPFCKKLLSRSPLSALFLRITLY